MKEAKKRKLDILVISDVHLGTYGCHATELLHYLKSVKPKTVILNGDIIDIWQFSKRYWPKAHMKIIKHFMEWVTKGVKIIYVTGNHDEMLRKFTGFKMGSFKIVDKIAAMKSIKFYFSELVIRLMISRISSLCSPFKYTKAF